MAFVAPIAGAIIKQLAVAVIMNISAKTEKKIRVLLQDNIESAINEVARLVQKHTPIPKNLAEEVAKIVIETIKE